MDRQTGAPRWDLVLPFASVLVATALVLLAGAATRARSEHRALTLEGSLNRAARGIEVALRDTGPTEAERVLQQELDASDGLLRGVALLSPAGRLQASAGTLDGPGTLEVDIFLGPSWRQEDRGEALEGPEPGAVPGERPPAAGRRGGRMGGGSHSGQAGGRRILRLVPAGGALARPWSERLLMPAVALAAVALVGLSVLGGRLLVRHQKETLREAEHQRLEGLARAGAGLAHQLRTPLATIKGTSQLLLEGAEGSADPRLRSIVEQTKRMERLLGELLDYARPPKAEPVPVAAEEMKKDLETLAPAGTRLRFTAKGTPVALVDREHLRQILANLVGNALQASPENEPVEVTVRSHGPRIEISISDRGPGPGEEPERLFEPYVTGRAGGTGLGLPITRALARANGGEVTLAAREGGGAVATVALPRARSER